MGLELEELAVVDDLADHRVDVVRLAVGLREHVEQAPRAALDRVGPRARGGRLPRSGRGRRQVSP
jgi:hypothetical protein